MEISFFCVGAQKAGTSTLHSILKQHPGISLPINKETHFFSDNELYSKGMSFYNAQFPHDQDSAIFGEIDPEYLYFEEAANRIKDAANPNTKIFVLLRNPIERAYSQYLMTKARGFENLTFEEAVQMEQERIKTPFGQMHFSYISRSKYLRQIERYTRLFDENNVHVYLFEDFIKDPKKIVDSISAQLNLPEFDFDYTVRSNPAHVPKSTLLRDFIYKPNAVKKFIGKLIFSEKIKYNIMVFLDKHNRKPFKKDVLDEKFKEALFTEFFKEETILLEKKLGVDLKGWKY